MDDGRETRSRQRRCTRGSNETFMTQAASPLDSRLATREQEREQIERRRHVIDITFHLTRTDFEETGSTRTARGDVAGAGEQPRERGREECVLEKRL